MAATMRRPMVADEAERMEPPAGSGRPATGSSVSTTRLDDLSDPSAASFGHIDDVCIGLLKQGQTAQALKYLQKMRAMIDSIVEKMGEPPLEPAPPSSAPSGGRKPAPPKRKTTSARGARTARIEAAKADEGRAAETARSLPVIKAIVPVDTAAERLAAKDLYISKLQEQKAELEEAMGDKDEEVRAARSTAAEAASKMRKREGDVKNMRALIRQLEQEASSAMNQAETLRAQLENDREVEAAAVSLEEYEDVRRAASLSQDRVKKLEGQVKQRDGKLKLLQERLEFAQKDAGMASTAKNLNEALQETQEKLASKNKTAKTSAKMLQRREKEIEELQGQLASVQSENLSVQGTLSEREKELASVTKRLEATMADYKGFRSMTVKLTEELDGSDAIKAERDSLRAQLADAAQIITKTAVKVEKYEHKVKASGVELHNSSKAMKNLTTDLEDAKAQLAKRTADTVALRGQIGPLREEIEKLQITVMEKEEHIEQLSDTSGKRMAKILSDLESAKAEASRVPGLSEELQAKKLELAHTQKVLEDLKGKFEQQAAANKEVGDFMAERNSWARKVMRLSIEPQLLRQRLSVQSNTMRFLEDEVARLESRAVVRELVSILADEHSAALTKELGETREVVASLEAQGAADRGELGVRANTIARLENEARIMNTELDELRRREEEIADVAELELQLAEEKRVAAANRNEAEVERQRSSGIERFLEKVKAEKEELAAKIVTLEESIVELQEDVKTRTADQVVKEAKLAELETQLEQSRSTEADLSVKRDELLVQVEDGAEMQNFLMAEMNQLKLVIAETREQVRQREDVIAEKERRFTNAGAELMKTKYRMREEKEAAVAFESSERERMRLALTEIILQRESTITEMCVLVADARSEADALSTEMARLEGLNAVMTEELAEAVVPIVVTVEEQQAVAETVEEMITLIELLDRVDDHQVQLYPSGAATTNTPQPTATPDIVEHDYSRAMANPVVSVRMVRGKRLFSI
jgi:chromosome segregation ATPase